MNTAIFNQSKVIKSAEMSQQKYKKGAGGSASRSNSRNRTSSYVRKDSVPKQKIYQAVFVTLTEKVLSLFKDKMTFEYNQEPTLTIDLENIVKVQVFKFVPGVDA